MAKARLLQAVCAVALMAAAPAFAQTTTQPADTSTGGSVNAPVKHDASAPNGATSQPKAAPAEKMGSTGGSGSSASMSSQPSHHVAMSSRSSGSMHGRTDSSQNSTVDQLNDQSYQAAHSGQAYSVSGMGASGSAMHDMSGGSTGSPAGTASGSGGGAGGSGGGSGK